CGLALFSTASLPPKPNSCGVYDAGSLKTDQRQISYFFMFPLFKLRTQGNRSTIEHDTTAHEIYTILLSISLTLTTKCLGRH
ncbi:hypothetical protein PO909_025958, partial [Leuciscus waleckii]